MELSPPLPIPQPTRSARFRPWQWLQQQPKRLSLRTKIGLGYMTAIGIALVGIETGMQLGGSYYHQAQLQRQDTLEELETIRDVQSGLVQLEVSRQRLLRLINEPYVFRQEYDRFVTGFGEILADWNVLKDHYNDHYERDSEVGETNEKTALIAQLINDHDELIHTYHQRVEATNSIQALDPALLTPIAAKTLTEGILRDGNVLPLLKIVEDMQVLSQTIVEEEAIARALENQAQRYQGLIVVTSILISTLLALGISILIARALLRPLRQVTDMARQVQQKADFDLRVSVSSKDEVGELADAFNALIDRVQTLMSEQSQTQAQLFQSEKMASLGQLVAGVAHEINNPVNFIHGNLTHFRDYAHQLLGIVQLYNTHYPEPVAAIEDAIEDTDIEFLQSDIPKMLSSMEMGTDRIRQIVLSLRNFSRLDEAEAKAVDLHEGIDNTLLILQHRLKERPERPAIQVIKQYGSLPCVECYPGQLNQVFMNIVANAIDAIEETGASQGYQDWVTHPGQITIRTRPMAGDWVGISIADNGEGMSEQTLKRLFDPFFTTKPVGKGTGIGMAISYQIITEGHKGTLDITSKLGKGTEVTIGIPVRGVLVT